MTASSIIDSNDAFNRFNRLLTFTTSAGGGNTSVTVPTSSDTNDLLETAWDVTLQSGSLTFICLFAVFGNFLVAFTLVRKEQLLIPSNRLVFNLTASNFAFSLLILPFVVSSAAQQKWLFGIFWCNFTAFLTLLIGIASVLTSAMIAVDRYYAIVKPLMYTMTITTSKSTAMLLWVWIQAAASSLPPLFGWSRFEYLKTKATCSVVWNDDIFYTAFLLSFSVFLPFGVMVTCYYFIFQVARAKCRKVHVGTVSDINGDVEQPGTRWSASTSLPTLKCQNKTHRLSVPRKPSLILMSYNSPTKGFRTICIVVGLFLVTWVPYIVMAIIEAGWGLSKLSSSFQVCATWLMYSSTVGYPIVYGVYNRSIRKEIRTCLRPPSSKAMKGLPRRNSRRLSFSGSLFEYSPFRVRNSSSRFSFDYGRASIDLGSLPGLSRNGTRRQSQDSGAIMTESDMDTDFSFLPVNWFGRHSASAKSRFHHFSTKLNMRRGRPMCPTTGTQSFPILQAINVAVAAEAPNSLTDDTKHAEEPECTTESFKCLVTSAKRQNPVMQSMADIPSILSLDENDRKGMTLAVGNREDLGSTEELLFTYKNANKRGDSIDEGIGNDCVLQDIE